MVSKFKVGLKPFLQQSLWGPEYYGDLVYKLKEVVSTADFSEKSAVLTTSFNLFSSRHIIICYKRTGYYINLKRQSACLVVNPVTVDNFAFLFNCTLTDRASESLMGST